MGLPAFMLFVALVILAGRLAIATQAVQASASQAARVASIARTGADAASAATSAASVLPGQPAPALRPATVTVDTTGFDVPVGTPAQVTATVTCAVTLADLSLPGDPGHRTVSATSSSPSTRTGRGDADEPPNTNDATARSAARSASGWSPPGSR